MFYAGYQGLGDLVTQIPRCSGPEIWTPVPVAGVGVTSLSFIRCESFPGFCEPYQCPFPEVPRVLHCLSFFVPVSNKI